MKTAHQSRQALMARCSRSAVGFMDVRVVGLCVLLAGFFSACSSPMSEELGVRPRPMYLQCSPLLRLVWKPLGDGVPPDLGVRAAFFFHRCVLAWGRKWAVPDSCVSWLRGSLGPLCNFSLLWGPLCKIWWTVVSSVVGLGGSRVCLVWCTWLLFNTDTIIKK